MKQNNLNIFTELNKKHSKSKKKKTNTTLKLKKGNMGLEMCLLGFRCLI